MKVPQYWTPQLVAEWLGDAAVALRATRDPERRYLANVRSWWPAVQNEMGENFAMMVAASQDGTLKAVEAELNRVKLHGATPEQVDRLYVVMGWMGKIEEVGAVRLVWARACGASWRTIARFTGGTRQAAQQRYRRILERLAMRLNRREPK